MEEKPDANMRPDFPTSGTKELPISVEGYFRRPILSKPTG